MKQYIIGFLLLMAATMFIHGFFKAAKENRKHHRSFGHKHGGAMISVDYYAYASRLRSWNAVFKSIFSLAVLIICLFCNNIYVSAAAILLMGYIVVVWGGLAFDHYFSMMMIPIVFLIMGSLAIALGFSLQPAGDYCLSVGNLFYVYSTKTGLLKAGNLVLKALGAVSAVYFLTLTTPLSELIAVLRKAHIPKLLIELMNMIYRYIFIMLDTHARMTNSAKSRLGYCDFKTSCYSFGQIASNLLVVSLKKGSNYYNAMEARCYEGELNFLEEEKAVKGQQILGAVIVVLLLVLIYLESEYNISLR